jgi:hypothetical protein
LKTKKSSFNKDQRVNKFLESPEINMDDSTHELVNIRSEHTNQRDLSAKKKS